MMEKRLKKLELVDKEVPLEMKVKFFGDKDSENIVVSWGSPKGAIIEALNQLKDEGLSLGFIQVRMIHPLPSAYLKQMLTGQKTHNRRRRQRNCPTRRSNNRAHYHQTNPLHS
jgi:2-oxoglutarate ferredoxin oxidoreductase subunit alpha